MAVIFEKEPELDKASVERILENVFAANKMPANKVPLEVQDSYSNYRRERYILQRILISIMLMIFILLPVLFITPAIKMDADKDIGAGRPAYELFVDTWLPIRSITAEIDGVNMPVSENIDGNYRVAPTMNGEMRVKVTLINDQSAYITQEVTRVDMSAPKLAGDSLIDGKLVLYVEDEGLGIDYTQCFMRTMDGTMIYPVQIDEGKGVLTFDYPTEMVNIFINDLVGNTLQLVIMVQ